MTPYEQARFDLALEQHKTYQRVIERLKNEKKAEAGPLWEQLSNEPDDKYFSFQVYLDLGSKRSYSIAARKLGKTKSTIYTWSKKYNWLARADAYDKSKYLESKAKIMDYCGAEIAKHYKNSFLTSRVAASILPELAGMLDNYDTGFRDDVMHKKVKYFLMLCKAIREGQALVDFFPEPDKFGSSFIDNIQDIETDGQDEENPKNVAERSVPYQSVQDNNYPPIISEMLDSDLEFPLKHDPETENQLQSSHTTLHSGEEFAVSLPEKNVTERSVPYQNVKLGETKSEPEPAEYYASLNRKRKLSDGY